MRNRSRLLALFAAACLSITAARAETNTIGVSLPLSGDASSYGTDYRKIFIFANDVLAGGTYRLIFEDDRCSGKDAVTVAQKLITMDKVRHVLGVACDTTFSSAAPVYSRAGVTVISTSSIHVPGKHLYHTGLESKLWAKPLYEYVSKRHKKIGVINEQTDFASNFAENFISFDEARALKITRETFNTSDDNLKPQLLRIRQSNPEAIVMATQTDSTLYRITKQLNEMDWKIPRYTTFFPGGEAFRKMAGPLAEGIIYSDFPDVMSVLDDEGKKIYSRFVAEHGAPSSGPGLFVIAFEAFRALDEALRSGKPIDEYLTTTTFHGILGDWRFQSDGFWSGFQHIVKRIENGAPVVIPG